MRVASSPGPIQTVRRVIYLLWNIISSPCVCVLRMFTVEDTKIDEDFFLLFLLCTTRCSSTVVKTPPDRHKRKNQRPTFLFENHLKLTFISRGFFFFFCTDEASLILRSRAIRQKEFQKERLSEKRSNNAGRRCDAAGRRPTTSTMSVNKEIIFKKLAKFFSSVRRSTCYLSWGITAEIKNRKRRHVKSDSNGNQS